MESSAGCLGAGFAKGGANSWALDLQTMGSFRSPAGPRMGAGLWVVEAVVEAIVGTTLVGTIGGPAFSNCCG